MDEVKMFCEYIIRKMLSVEDSKFLIKFKRELRNDIFYIVEERNEKNELIFYLKIFCKDKKEFYDYLNKYLIEYYRCSEFLEFGGVRDVSLKEKELLLSFFGGTKVSMYFDYENLDILLKMKNYLDVSLNWFQRVNDAENLSGKKENCLKKIML